VLFGKTFRQESVANRARKRNVNDPTNMHVSYFCTPEPEFLASEAMGMNRSIWPRGNFFFESFQVRHNLQPSDLFFDDRMQNSPFIGRTSVIQEQAG